jgi:hypothetical protein
MAPNKAPTAFDNANSFNKNFQTTKQLVKMKPFHNLKNSKSQTTSSTS